MKLFCFTYAGGTASFYEQIEDLLPKSIEVIKLEYAGVIYYSYMEEILCQIKTQSYTLFF